MTMRRLGPTWLDTVWRDVRHAARALAHSPAFAATAVLSLALGIGATTTIFSVVHAVVIDPVPVPQSRHAASAWRWWAPDGRGNWSSYTIDEYVELAERATVFDGLIASTISDVSMTGAGAPERLRGNYVSMNTFDVMGVPAAARPDGPRRPTREPTRRRSRFSAIGSGSGSSAAIPTRRRPDAAAERRAARGHRRDAAALHVARRRRLPADALPAAACQLPGVRTVHVMGRLRPGVAAARGRGVAAARSRATSRRARPSASRRRSASCSPRSARRSPAAWARRWACCSARSACCCSSPAATSRTCSSRARRRAPGRWRSGRRSARAAGASCVSS